VLVDFKSMQVIGISLQSHQKTTERHVGCPETQKIANVYGIKYTTFEMAWWESGSTNTLFNDRPEVFTAMTMKM
jgi:hypothetical protein